MPKQPTFMVIAGTWIPTKISPSDHPDDKRYAARYADGYYQLHVSTPKGTVWKVLHNVRINAWDQLSGSPPDFTNYGYTSYPWWDRLLSIGTPQFFPADSPTGVGVKGAVRMNDRWKDITTEYRRRVEPFSQATVYETEFFTSTNPPKHSFPLFDLDF